MPDQSNVKLILSEWLRNHPIKDEEQSSESYHALLRTRREAYIKSGVRISEDEAKDLVWQHPLMPSPSGEKLDKRALKEHVEGPVNNGYLWAIVFRALFSIEEVMIIEKVAEISPLHFDALFRAASIALNPSFDQLDFPTKERLGQWFSDVGIGRITRPTRHRKGRDPFKNIVRDRFLYEVVEDLRSCGLPKRPNDETVEPRLSACGVVAEVCGLEVDAVRMAVDKFKKPLS